jgi:hypothetical protein
MAYPTPEGIGEAAVGSGMAGIQFMLAVQMELLKEYDEATRAWMSEVKLWSKLAAKLSTSASILPISILTQAPHEARRIAANIAKLPWPR